MCDWNDVFTRRNMWMRPTLASCAEVQTYYARFSELGTRLPEVRTQTTGSETAAELLRQCWANTPLSAAEKASLRNVAQFCQLSPALAMRCYELDMTARQMAHLHPAVAGSDEADQAIALSVNAVTEYNLSTTSRSFRQCLSAAEECRVFGVTRAPRKLRRSCRFMIVDGAAFTTPLSFVEVSEAALLSICTSVSNENVVVPPFPLSAETTVVGEAVRAELSNSWTAYHRLPECSIAEDGAIEGIKAQLEILSINTLMHLNTTEAAIISNINSVHSVAVNSIYSRYAVEIRANRLANRAPTAGRVDLLRIAADPSLLWEFNPALTAESCALLNERILLWLKLCVLCDKLDRLCAYCASAAPLETRLVAELQEVRVWDAAAHVKWLVLEAEGHLQIRPIQYHVAQSLIGSIEGGDGARAAGVIAQLNMGEGKTRVILPMLVLHFANKKDTVRLLFLSQLLRDAYQYLHQHLSASVLQRKAFLFPFNRDVKLTAAAVDVMLSQLQFCRDSRGFVCVAPEDRLSLRLKWHELNLSKINVPEHAEICDKLRLLDEQLRFVDLLDESDLLLHHKFQLVYAVGDRMALPGGPSRWYAAQALLRVIDNSERVWALLSAVPGVCVYESERSSEAFRSVRLLSGQALSDNMSVVVEAIAEELVQEPTYEFGWIGAQTASVKRCILQFITNASALDSAPLLAALGGINSKPMQDLLALRGLLACTVDESDAETETDGCCFATMDDEAVSRASGDCGVLFHCLQKRHRIDYGVKRPGKLQLAVPFRAADTPSERAEFGHPDSAIVYTMLAYYADGLSDEQLRKSFSKLLLLGRSARNALYSEWFAISAPLMGDDETRGQFDSVDKIDLSNATQRAQLGRFFRRNRETVNFFLANLVLPGETMQYPQRLMANAWGLCDNAAHRPVGFSGTDDNKLLLPLQVEQLASAHPQISATNGKMMRLILRDDKYSELSPQNADETALWQTVIIKVHITANMPFMLKFNNV